LVAVFTRIIKLTQVSRYNLRTLLW